MNTLIHTGQVLTRAQAAAFICSISVDEAGSVPNSFINLITCNIIIIIINLN